MLKVYHSDKTTACFICNKKGHWANECPKGDGASKFSNILKLIFF